jgi:hypothetical protein
MKVAALAIGLCLVLATPALAVDRERDWTVEHPMLAGFATGLSLSVCRSCRLGGAPVPADAADPFAMTPVVRHQLIELGRRPYAIGTVLGSAYAVTVIGGIFFWRLNTLKERTHIELVA